MTVFQNISSIFGTVGLSPVDNQIADSGLKGGADLNSSMHNTVYGQQTRESHQCN
jgi:hypothetical protein